MGPGRLPGMRPDQLSLGGATGCRPLTVVVNTVLTAFVVKTVLRAGDVVLLALLCNIAGCTGDQGCMYVLSTAEPAGS